MKRPAQRPIRTSAVLIHRDPQDSITRPAAAESAIFDRVPDKMCQSQNLPPKKQTSTASSEDDVKHLKSLSLFFSLGMLVSVAGESFSAPANAGTHHSVEDRCLWMSNYWYKKSSGGYHVQAITRDNGTTRDGKTCSTVTAGIRSWPSSGRTECHTGTGAILGYNTKTVANRTYVASVSTTVSANPLSNYVTFHQSPNDHFGKTLFFCG